MGGRLRDTAGNFINPDDIVSAALEGSVTDATLLAAVTEAVTEAMQNTATDAELAAAIQLALESIPEVGDTFVTNITEQSTFITQVTNNIVQTYVNAKKGEANELATLGADSKHTPSQIPPGSILVIFDGGAASIAAGLQADVVIPLACTLTGWTLVATPLAPAATGSIQIDIWKDTYANFPPTVADTIISGAKPAISAGVKATDTSISDWSGEAIAAGSILRFNVDSATDIQRCTLALTYQRT